MLSAGYAIHAGVFSAPEIAALASRLDRISLTRSRAGARQLMNTSCVAEISSDSRLTQIAGAWLDGKSVAFRATLFEKSADANWLVAWHQDTALPVEGRRDLAAWGPWSTKAGVHYAHAPASALERVIALRVHLDESRDDNGPLRVLPGTHQRGIMTDAQVHACAQTVPAVTCCVGGGGVIAMRPLIVHASSKVMSDRPRRVLHIEYAASLRTDDGMTLRPA